MAVFGHLIDRVVTSLAGSNNVGYVFASVIHSIAIAPDDLVARFQSIENVGFAEGLRGPIGILGNASLSTVAVLMPSLLTLAGSRPVCSIDVTHLVYHNSIR